MEISSPLVFEPLFMERVWGGRRMEAYGKRLPQTARVGESWEIVDRPEAQSVVHEGTLRGATLHELWMEHREEIFGSGLPDTPRFPLLCKILDAQERLSLQVHPPAKVAGDFGGEPKTEMWYVLDASAESDLYAGLRSGATRETFQQALQEGRVADQIHHFKVKKGDAIFIPSGRVHAIGSGNLIMEVQQNSDTTYRVFDWNRIGLDGKPRALHVRESMESIIWDDIEPGLAPVSRERPIVECGHFRVERWDLSQPTRAAGEPRFAIYAVTEGQLSCGGRIFTAGEFFLLTAALATLPVTGVDDGAQALRITIP